MEVLVTGGAGYVGSHVVRELRDEGFRPVVLDDLSQGHREAVGESELVVADFADRAALDRLLGERRIEWVVHMAAFCEVGASMGDPGAYYRNNLSAGIALLESAVRHRAQGIVFSSTAAVYGEPRDVPIDEAHPKLPTNPYGETKLAFERALGWFHRAHGLASVSLRYFNAAGAHPDGSIGEDHEPESHLIPRLLRAARDGGEPVPIFGSDFPTRDGTCVRDYVHVVDLAAAHVAALRQMQELRITCDAFNLGNGAGFSVLEVIDAVGRVTGQSPPTARAARRAGDPAQLVAASERARGKLGFRPRFPEIDAIVGTAWEWHRRHPRGFGSE